MAHPADIYFGKRNEGHLEELIEKQKIIDKAPFVKLKIDDTSCLNTIEGREICSKCLKSRKFFCYTCYTPVIDEKYIPRVKLPIQIDVIKHAKEIDGKSTAVHAAILAPVNVKIYTYPDFPVISETDRTILIFPGKTAMTVDDLFTSFSQEVDTSKDKICKTLPITRAIFIDSTWDQTKGIYKDKRLRELPCVILRSRISQFWRHQKKSPRWYLATIEAIHQFLVELHVCAYGVAEEYDIKDEKTAAEEVTNITTDTHLCEPYKGQYDNLLYFFKYMYDKIHTIYEYDKLWSYKRPLI